MTTLVNGREQAIGSGIYSYTADITTGTITISISIDGNPFVTVTDGIISATETGVMTLPVCNIKAVYSGDAVFALGQVR